ncbi:inorganic triphosphatase YgiF [Bradyrhizobium sp. USDA 372]
MNAETELKFRLAPRKLSSVLRDGALNGQRGDRSEQDLVSTYYDTSKQKLRRHGLTLRIRKVGDRYVQTVKAGGAGTVTRGEWEHEVAGARPDFKQIKNTPLANLASKKLPRKLRAGFGPRSTARLKQGGCDGARSSSPSTAAASAPDGVPGRWLSSNWS